MNLHAPVLPSTSSRRKRLVDCNVVLDSVLERLWDPIIMTDGTVVVDQLPVVWGNDVQLRDAFAAIVEGALHLGASALIPGLVPKPCIHLGVRREHAFWRFEVHDTATGASTETAQLYRLVQHLHARNIHDGGLGTAQQIVELHGGRIWIESKPSTRVRLVFTLPVALTVAPTSPEPLHPRD